jgi:hypothetical protein
MSPYRSIQHNGKNHHREARVRMPKLGGALVCLAIGGLLGLGVGLGLGILIRVFNPPLPVVHVPPPSQATDPAVWKEREKETLAEIRKHIDSLTPGLAGGNLLSIDPGKDSILGPAPTLRPVPAP